MVDSVMQINNEGVQLDYAITPSKDAMQKFRTYLVRENKNYRPVITDPEILACPKNTTQKGTNHIYGVGMNSIYMSSFKYKKID